MLPAKWVAPSICFNMFCTCGIKALVTPHCNYPLIYLISRLEVLQNKDHALHIVESPAHGTLASTGQLWDICWVNYSSFSSIIPFDLDYSLVTEVRRLMQIHSVTCFVAEPWPISWLVTHWSFLYAASLSVAHTAINHVFASCILFTLSSMPLKHKARDFQNHRELE